jgi:hypothetical protein
MIYADTSFIASAYGLDANTAAARRFIETSHPRLPLVFLHWPELAKSFWTGHPENAEKLWDWVKEDLAGGKKLYPLELEADVVARRAAGLIIHFCPRWKKLRSLDALHVAVAVGAISRPLSRSTRAVFNAFWRPRKNSRSGRRLPPRKIWP